MPVLGLQQIAAEGQDVQSFQASKHDKSKPLLKMVRRRPEPAPPGKFVEHTVRHLPLPRKTYPTPTPPITVQGGSGPLDMYQLPPFQGVGRGIGYITRSSPPDTNGSAGPLEFVQWVNNAYGIFDKKTGKLKPIKDPNTGHMETELLDGNQLWQGFGGKCEFSNDGDPIVLYDKLASRWVMAQFAYSKPAGPPYAECIAVSSSSDPAGQYARYEFDFNNFNDYPKFGVWPNGYYATFNMFENENGDFFGTKVCAFERAKMLAAADRASMQCVNLYNPPYGGLLPADFDGLQSTAPSDQTPEVFVGLDANKLDLWRYHVDWDEPRKSTLDRNPVEIPVAPFDFPCQNGDKQISCIMQPGDSAQKLDSLGDRLMYRLAYRNFGSRESLVVNHTVKVGDHTGIRWYELSDLSGTPSVVQQGTFSPEDGLFRWIGSIAMDKKGNILLGYSASGSSVYPSIRFTGRLHEDALGTMRNESILMIGQGSQVSTVGQYVTDRWGDYSSVSLDPEDDCTFWFTSQYQTTTETYRWNTAVFGMRFKDCQ
jgi:hypothetical protein